ncbi:helix-turn-helix domain-containing protein [Pseudonocardia sp. CA-107938]|uniref:helix-turn-helix domain-containing protein n=1 Tax=Pseudonocardia sp. CA-107938 TaxID=3240021 RepID=UPI003D8DEEC2
MQKLQDGAHGRRRARRARRGAAACPARQRGATLADLAATTGLSQSLLSRLESGKRRPTLEVLMSLARAYRVPLDELVGAPDTGDPRVHLRPRTYRGRVIVPLTSHPGPLQAYKQVLPGRADDADLPAPVTHDGYEWFYVLSGRLRLILNRPGFARGSGSGHLGWVGYPLGDGVSVHHFPFYGCHVVD